MMGFLLLVFFVVFFWGGGRKGEGALGMGKVVGRDQARLHLASASCVLAELPHEISCVSVCSSLMCSVWLSVSLPWLSLDSSVVVTLPHHRSTWCRPFHWTGHKSEVCGAWSMFCTWCWSLLQGVFLLFSGKILHECLCGLLSMWYVLYYNWLCAIVDLQWTWKCNHTNASLFCQPFVFLRRINSNTSEVWCYVLSRSCGFLLWSVWTEEW